MPKPKSLQKWKKFHCSPLSEVKKLQIREEANVACDELLKYSAMELLGNPDEEMVHQLKWTFQEQIQSIRIEKVKIKSSSSSSSSGQKKKTKKKKEMNEEENPSHRSKSKSLYYFRGLTQMEATIEEVMNLYQVEEEDQPNVNLQKKLSPDLLHSVLLYQVKPHDFLDNTIFIGIRWSALRSPYVLVRNRDFCYLEIQRRFTLPDGRRGFVRCLHSVKMKCCPELEETHGFVRASMYRSGFVFVESRRDRRYLEVIQAVYSDLKGNVPRWVAFAGIKNRMMGLEIIQKHIQMKRIANQDFMRRSQMMPRGTVKTCFVCVDDIGTFKRSFNCQKCGEVVCRRCKLVVYAEIPVVGKMKLNICSLCALAINRSVLPDTQRCSEVNHQHGDYGGLGDRPFSVTPVCTNKRQNQMQSRPRALSLNSFHTASFELTELRV